MTVGELIAKLQALPQADLVVFKAVDSEHLFEIEDAGEHEIDRFEALENSTFVGAKGLRVCRLFGE